ncbi:MAG TPA: hypothetical protein VM575_07105 [Nocardioides sp.]|nr:hypothetical protein [Nocardioides sp.]
MLDEGSQRVVSDIGRMQHLSDAPRTSMVDVLVDEPDPQLAFGPVVAVRQDRVSQLVDARSTW